MCLNYAILAIDGVIEQVTGEDTGALGDLPSKTAGVGNSFLAVLLLFGVFAVVSGIILAGIRISAGGQNTRAEGKSRIPDILIGAILVIGAISIISALASFIPHLFS